MNNKRRNNFILAFFSLAITWISIVHYDPGVYGFFYNFYDHGATQIEFVLQPPLSDTFQSGEGLSAFTQHFQSPAEWLANPIPAFRLFSKQDGLIDRPSNGQPVVLPLQRLISILHKTHTWHQSSDDDPFPHPSSLA